MKAPKRYALNPQNQDEQFYTVEQDDDGTWRWYWQGDEEGTDLDMGRPFPTRAAALRNAAIDAEGCIGSDDGDALARRLRLAATLTERSAK